MIKKDQYLADVFPQPAIKTKVAPPPKRETRQIKGMIKCGKSCANCPYVKEGKIIKINKDENWIINKQVNCETYNCIY